MFPYVLVSLRPVYIVIVPYIYIVTLVNPLYFLFLWFLWYIALDFVHLSILWSSYIVSMLYFLFSVIRFCKYYPCDRPIYCPIYRPIWFCDRPIYRPKGHPQNIPQKYDLRCRWRTCLGRSWQKRPVRPFQLQLCQLLPVAASISASTRCMWIPVHFGVHFGVHFAFFLETWGEGKQDGRPAPWNPRLLRNRQLCVELFKKKTF